MSTEAQHPIDTEGPGDPSTRFCLDLSNIGPTPTRIDGMRAILARADLMWSNGSTITVGFVQPAPGTPVQQNKVKEVVKQWEKVANIKFRFVPTGVEANNAQIRVSFDPNNGSWSLLGKAALDQTLVDFKKPNPTLNLGWVFSGPTTAPDEQGVILHEFGHAIGYLHEHQSPRRGEKLTLNKEVIYKATRLQRPPWSKAQTDHNIINVYDVQEVSNFSEVDVTSIMMYFMPASWNLQGLKIEETTELSPLDKAFAFLNYPFIGGVTSSDASVTLQNALDTIGITGESRSSIEEEFAQGDWQGVRAEFTRWSINEKAIHDNARIAAERAEGGEVSVAA